MQSRQPQRLTGVAEDAAEGRRVPLGQLPRLLAVDVLVGGVQQTPDGLQGAVEREGPHGVGHPGIQRLGSLAQPPIRVGHRLAGGGDAAVQVAADHAQGALQQVAQVVGEVGVEAGDQRLLAEVGVQAERHLAQQEVAEGVQAVLVLQVERRRTRPRLFDILASSIVQ